MPYKFFHIPLRNENPFVAELNEFLRSHRVLSVERRWVEQGENSCWSFCIDYTEKETAHEKSARPNYNGRQRVDYSEVLSADEFAVYAKLRDLRKKIAEEESVPLYTIFTNEHLAQMARKPPKTKSDLQKIDRIGESRVEKYGERVLKFLADELQGNAKDAPSEQPF